MECAVRPVQEWFNINKLVTELKPGKAQTAFYTKQLAVTVTLWYVSIHPQDFIWSASDSYRISRCWNRQLLHLQS